MLKHQFEHIIHSNSGQESISTKKSPTDFTSHLLAFAKPHGTLSNHLGVINTTEQDPSTGSVLSSFYFLVQSNSLGSYGLLHADATIVELSFGISGLVDCILARHVSSYVLTDQEHLTKIPKEDTQVNAIPLPV